MAHIRDIGWTDGAVLPLHFLLQLLVAAPEEEWDSADDQNTDDCDDDADDGADAQLASLTWCRRSSSDVISREVGRN